MESAKQPVGVTVAGLGIILGFTGCILAPGLPDYLQEPVVIVSFILFMASILGLDLGP